MGIPNEIIDSIHSDPLQAAVATCNFVISEVKHTIAWGPLQHELLLEGFALISTMEEAGLIEFIASPGYIEGDRDGDCLSISIFLTNVLNELDQQLASHKLESLKKKFAGIITSTFAYEFTEGDVARIQTLINELRELIATNEELEDQHKRRLLKRLEKLQSEMHKKMSDLDHFYGLTVEGSVMLKKVGGNLKPIVDRISEITKITWATQSRAEDLPSGSEPPLLGSDDEQARLERE
ncbi:hypothetical protein ACJJU9_07295 [Pseudomonas helleri]|uniref:hypothetical protein n=1 Tax=Pseudomonas helleri TaxID=1608996 RepID=UPI00389A1CC6